MAKRAAIAIDYSPALAQGGGIGRYTRELVRALAALDRYTEYRLFAAGYRRKRLPAPPGANFRWAPCRLNTAWLARLWHRARIPIPVEAWTGPIGLFHATDFTLPPVQRGTRTLLTVHDLSFVRAPETATAGLRAYLNRVAPRSAERADHILADSEATRQDLIELYGLPPEKISVLLCGIEPRFAPVTDAATLARVRERYGIGEGPFILSVGTVQPRKNYARLAEAFRRLDRPGLRLVITGGEGWLEDETIASLRRDDRVHFTGFVDDEDLPALYSSAVVFAFPSLYEGFGLPPLEAMACGAPVVCSRTSSLPEVVSDAGILIDPLDVDALAEALDRLVGDGELRSSLRTRGLVRARQFTWEKAAETLTGIYRALLEEQT